MKKILTIAFLLLTLHGFSQIVERVEPPFWWAGMKNSALQLMVYGADIANCEVSLSEYVGIKIESVERLKNPNYLIINLTLSPDVAAKTFAIIFKNNNNKTVSYDYVLKKRTENSAERQGFNPSDVMYLITPDRFANGNPANDAVAGMPEQPNRADKDGRHGGDIDGILQHLDYIKNMGFTSIWLNPLLENNMSRTSYHGYSTTDFYKVDARFGSNEEYVTLSKAAKAKGIKMIMDMIANHNGSEHWWMKDLPTDDWVNYQAEYLKGEFVLTSHRKSTVQDPYVSKIDKERFTDGWFVPTMPDLNQRNPYMAKYLIQNAIWWVEYADLAGIRMDTYPYPGADYMKDWSCAVLAEYPNLNIVGEEWHENPSIVAFWQAGKENSNGATSCLPSLMDFPLQFQLKKALTTSEDGFSTGWFAAYQALANDFIYADPFNFVIFPDNHDMSRFYTQVDENFELFKLGIAYIATMRGIPQLYYGTEVLMTNPGTEDHGIIRSDFPGGWAGDKANAFTGEGLTTDQKTAQDFIKNILNWRKTAEVIHHGKLLHYNPQAGIYVYFRYTNHKRVMVVLSKNKADYDMPLDWYKEGLAGFTKGKDIISGQSLELKSTLKVPAMSPMIIELN